MLSDPNELSRIYESIVGRQLITPVPNAPPTGAVGPLMHVFFKYSELVEGATASSALARYRELLSSVPVINAVGIVAVINNTLSVEMTNPDTYKRLNAQYLSNDLQDRLAAQNTTGATPVVFHKPGCLALMRDLLCLGQNYSGETSGMPITIIGEMAVLANEFASGTIVNESAGTPDDRTFAAHFASTWDLANSDDFGYAIPRIHSFLRFHLSGSDARVVRLRNDLHLDPDKLSLGGLTLEEYIAMAFGLWGMGQKVVTDGIAGAVLSRKNVLKSVAFPQRILDTFIDNFALTPEQFKDEVKADFDISAENLDEKLASKEYSIPALNVFRQNPLLRLNDDQILITDLQFVANMMTSQIHWYLFNQTPSEQRGAFRSLWGYLFELYAVGMFTWFYPETSKLLTVDAGYSGGQIDAFLDFGPAVFLFEIKASLLTQPAKRGGSLSDFEADVRKKFLLKEGIPQLVNSCAALRSGVVKTIIPSPVVFPIMVVDEPGLISFGFNSWLNDEFRLQVGTDEKVRPLTVMSIQELEEVLPYTAKNIFSWAELLESRFKSDFKVDAFSIHQAVLSLRSQRGNPHARNDYLLEQFGEIYKTIEKMYRGG